MSELKIRRIDAATFATIREEAQKRKIGTETLARHILIDYATTAKIRAAEDRYIALAKDMTALFKNQEEELQQLIEENQMIMEELIKIVRGEE